MFRSKAEKKVVELGYDPERLPPGQYLTDKWPVLHAGDVARYPADLAGWDFRVWGEVESPVTLDWAGLMDVAKVEVTQDIHCVTRWSRFDVPFSGVSWAAIEELVASEAVGALRDRARGGGVHDERPASSLRLEGAMLATHADGAPLEPDHGWPLRLVVPGQVLLEEREVAAGDRARRGRSARVLGALRLPQRRRPVRGRALRVLSVRRGALYATPREPRRPQSGPVTGIGEIRRRPSATRCWAGSLNPPSDGQPA